MDRVGEVDKKSMILYEDRDILVCHKAAGLPVQSAGIGTKDMENILINYLAEERQEEKSGTVRPGSRRIPYLGVVHRLDQPVEGIIVFAKNKKAAAGLSRQISAGTMKKVYIAVCCVDKVCGSVDKKGISGEDAENCAGKNEENGAEGEEIHLVSWMKKEARINTSALVSADTPGAKRAELKYRVLQSQTIQGREYVLVRIELLTGRHHQIRVQMAGAGLPLYGDRKYNARWKEYHAAGSGAAGTNLMLCAAELTFDHPATGKKLHFTVKPAFLSHEEAGAGTFFVC